MLGVQFYVKSDTTMFPVILVLFCMFSMQYMVKKLHLFHISLLFECFSELRFDQLLCESEKKNYVSCHIYRLLHVFNAIHVFVKEWLLFHISLLFECFLSRNAFLSGFGRERHIKTLVMSTRVSHEIELRTKIWCLKANSYMTSDKTMIPVIFILFCRFSMQYMY